MHADTRPRVAILGAGAMGTLFAYYLAEHNDVTLVDVRGDVVEGINEAGGVQVDDLPVRRRRRHARPARAFATNYLFAFVKAPNTLGASVRLRGQLNPATPIVSLQNGFGNEEAIKTASAARFRWSSGSRTRPAWPSATAARAARASERPWSARPARRPRRCATSASDLWRRPRVRDRVRHPAPPVGQAARERRDQPDLGAGRREERHRRLGSRRRGTRPCGRPRGAAVAHAARQPAVCRPVGIRASIVALSADGTQFDDGRSRRAIENGDRLRQRRDRRAGRRLGIPTPYNEALVRLVKAKQNAIARVVPSGVVDSKLRGVSRSNSFVEQRFEVAAREQKCPRRSGE
jgi:hypothetical protein